MFPLGEVDSAMIVDLDAVTRNVRTVQLSAPGVTQMGVVKAQAYGHGAVPISRALVAAGVPMLGVAHISEALELRAAGITVPVLAWLATPGAALAAAVEQGIQVAVSTEAGVTAVAHHAEYGGRSAAVHLKVDTGMSRGGARMTDWPTLVTAAARLEQRGLIEVVGVMSHLACADTPTDPSVAQQQMEFDAALGVVKKSGITPTLIHLANSAATLALPATHYTAVRTGLALYGLSPFENVNADDCGLRPVAHLAAKVALTKRVPAGQGVSYGLTYQTKAPATLALVPLGYGDGISRRASNCAPVLVAGCQHVIAGRVCMDQFVCDVGDDPVSDGDLAVLWGPGDGGEPTVQDWAQVTGTISYEIVTQVSARVPRIYHRSGQADDTIGNEQGSKDFLVEVEGD